MGKEKSKCNCSLVKSVLSWGAFLFVFWAATKFAYILSPQNALQEAKCWTIQFIDSLLIPADIWAVRDAHVKCTAALKDEFPQGSSWDNVEDIVELTPANMSTYLQTAKNPLDRPFIIRGFLHVAGSEDIARYTDIDYLAAQLGNHNYSWDSKAGPIDLPLHEAFERMKGGEGLYVKFNREMTRNNPVLDAAVTKSAEVLKQLGGQIVSDMLFQNEKVTFLTYGEDMDTPLHNALPSNWFFAIAGTKIWKLYNPRHSIYLQPLNFANTVASTSTYNTSNPKGPKYISVSTHAGDFLYFPSFWLHEVDNHGPGLKFAIGLRPSLLGLREMMKTAFIPFYENPAHTTGLAMAHVGPAGKIILNTLAAKVQKRIHDLIYGPEPEDESGLTFFEKVDRQRANSWWQRNVVGNVSASIHKTEPKLEDIMNG